MTTIRNLIVITVILFTGSAFAQDIIVTDDTNLLIAIERSKQLELEGYEYVNRDAFSQDSRRYRKERHDRNDSQIYIDPVAKTYSYKPYRPNVFNQDYSTYPSTRANQKP